MGEKAPYEPDDEIFSARLPGVAVDVVLIALLHDDLKVGIIQRQDDPYFGKYALPGRFVRYDEKIEDTAKKALEGKGNINTDGIFLEQLYTFGQNLMRDTRIRTISVVYYALVHSDTITSQPGNTFTWHSVYQLPELAFDHADIIKFSLERMRKRLFTSDLIFNMVPKEFTLTELQKACEVLLDEELDKRNFRKKINELYALKDLKRTKMVGAHRPAKLYEYTKMR